MSSFDMTEIQRAMQRFGAAARKTNREVLETAAKGFLKEVVALTPPASSKAGGAAAKKAGEATIQGDVLKLAQPVFAAGRGAQLATAADILAAHKRARSGNAGRVNPRARKEKLFAVQVTVLRVIAQLQKKVGWLAAGWNESAAKLGVRLPAWVKRHGNQYGNASVTITGSRIRIELENVVSFVGDVKGYERRVARALWQQAQKMHRQADALLQKAIRRAGL